MILQTIQLPFDAGTADTIFTKQGETGRGIMFNLPFVLTLAEVGDYRGEFIVVKPDDTFVIQPLQLFGNDDENAAAYVLLDEQVSAAKGRGGYIIKVKNYIADNEVIYSAAGGLYVDDHLLMDSMIESIAEANGYVFPDDFLTVGDLVEIIDDNAVVTDKTWSSSKIQQEIEEHTPEPVSKTETGNPLEITDAADAPVVRCAFQIQGYQEGSGTPAPDNIRHIVAYAGGDVIISGKNLCPEEPSIEGYGIDSSGYIVASANYGVFDADIISGKFTIKLSDSNTSASKTLRIVYGDTEPYTILAEIGYTRATNTFPVTITVPNGVKHLRLSVRTVSAYNIMLSYGETEQSYVPFTGSSIHTATFPTDIYSGEWDGVAGTVRTDWGYIASYAGETLPGAWISDRDEYVPGTQPTIGAEVAYELAAPTTDDISITNLPIRTLSGYNHIESNTGDLEVEYITETYEPIITSVETEIAPPLVFSSTGVKVGKWIDGRDLYTITLRFTPTRGSRTNYSYTIDNIREIAFGFGGFKNTANDTIITAGAWNDSGWGASISILSINTIEYQFGTSWPNVYECEFTIFYTVND